MQTCKCLRCVSIRFIVLGKTLFSISFRHSWQKFISKSKPGHRNTTYNCPMSYKCQCHVSFNVKEFPGRTELWISGKHDRMSHINDRSKGLTDLQRLGVQQSVRACPMQVGSVVVDRSKKFSPLKRIPVSGKNVRAASRMVRKERRVVLGGDLLEGITINGSNGAMTRVAEALSLPRLIQRDITTPVTSFIWALTNQFAVDINSTTV
jgi:hypothetical protein